MEKGALMIEKELLEVDNSKYINEVLEQTKKKIKKFEIPKGGVQTEEDLEKVKKKLVQVKNFIFDDLKFVKNDENNEKNLNKEIFFLGASTKNRVVGTSTNFSILFSSICRFMKNFIFLFYFFIF